MVFDHVLAAFRGRPSSRSQQGSQHGSESGHYPPVHYPTTGYPPPPHHPYGGGEDWEERQELEQLQMALVLSQTEAEVSRSKQWNDDDSMAKAKRESQQSIGNAKAEALASKYWESDSLSYEDILCDGFYELWGQVWPEVQDKVFPTLQMLRDISVSPDDPREVVLVDLERDPALRAVSQRAEEEFLKTVDQGGKACAAALARVVADHMGGPVKAPSELQARSKVLTRGLKAARRSPVLPIGELRQGLPRHRALLFKALADAFSVPCRLLRGRHYTGREDGALAIISYEGLEFRVDLMERPGEVTRVGLAGPPGLAASAPLGLDSSDAADLESAVLIDLDSPRGPGISTVPSDPSPSFGDDPFSLGPPPRHAASDPLCLDPLALQSAHSTAACSDGGQGAHNRQGSVRSNSMDASPFGNSNFQTVPFSDGAGLTPAGSTASLGDGLPPRASTSEDQPVPPNWDPFAAEPAPRRNSHGHARPDLGRPSPAGSVSPAASAFARPPSWQAFMPGPPPEPRDGASGSGDHAQGVDPAPGRRRGDWMVEFQNSPTSPNFMGAAANLATERRASHSEAGVPPPPPLTPTLQPLPPLLNGPPTDPPTSASDPTPSSSGAPLYDTGPGGRGADPDEWEISAEDIELGPRIGIGSYGEVYRGLWLQTEVAVKRFILQDPSPKLLEEFRAEVAIMKRLKHPNVVLFMGACTQPPNLCIVTQYVSRGSLFRLLHRTPNAQLDHRRKMRMALDVARGMNYLHSCRPPIIHRDLKSPNLLVEKDYSIKVCDFGLARVRRSTWIYNKSGAGTPEWTAPEVLGGQRYNEKSDIYSYGVILWELFTGQEPWADKSPMQVVGCVGYGGALLTIPDDIEPGLAELMRVCWSKPEERPSFGEIIKMLMPMARDQSGSVGKEAAAATPPP